MQFFELNISDNICLSVGRLFSEDYSFCRLSRFLTDPVAEKNHVHLFQFREKIPSAIGSRKSVAAQCQLDKKDAVGDALQLDLYGRRGGRHARDFHIISSTLFLFTMSLGKTPSVSKSIQEGGAGKSMHPAAVMCGLTHLSRKPSAIVKYHANGIF